MVLPMSRDTDGMGISSSEIRTGVTTGDTRLLSTACRMARNA
nr:MAG TPA: hypothetical protein [Bacteriophage sp.]